METRKEFTYEQLNEMLNDPAFNARIAQARSNEEFVAILNENGIHLTEEEFQKGYTQAKEVLSEKGYLTEDGELSEEMLEAVAGGSKAAMYGGAVAGFVGLALMMSGPIGWGAIGLWAGGCAISLLGAADEADKVINRRRKRR